MTAISSAGASGVTNSIDITRQAGNPIQPRSVHYAPPTEPSGPATSGAAPAFGVAASARQEEGTAPKRVDITV